MQMRSTISQRVPLALVVLFSFNGFSLSRGLPCVLFAPSGYHGSNQVCPPMRSLYSQCLPWVKPRCALPCVLSALSGYHGSNPGVPSHAFSLLSVATMGQTQVCPPMHSLCSQWLPWVKPRCALPCVLSALSGYHGSNPGVPSHAFSLLSVATMGQTQVCPPMRSLCSQWLPWVKPRCALPCVLSTLSGYHGSNPGVPSHAFSLLSVATMGQTQVCPPMRSLCSQCLPWVKPRCALPCVLSAPSAYHGSNPGVPSHAFSLLSVATMGQTQVCPPMRSLCSQWLPWVKPRCALPCVLSTLSGYHGSNPGVPSHAFSLLSVATMGQTQVCPPMRSLYSQWLPWVKPRCALPCVLSALSGYHGSNPGVPSHAFSLLSVATMGQIQVCPPMRSLCSQWLPWVKPRCALPCVLSTLSGYHGSNPGVPSHAFSLLSVATMGQTQVCPPMRSLYSQCLPWVKPRCAIDSSSQWLPWVKPRCALPCVLSAPSGYHGSNPGVPSHAFSLLSVATMGQTQVCPPMRSLCSQWLPWVKPRCALPCVLSTLSGYHGSNPGVPSHAFSLLSVATMGQTQVCPPMRSLYSQWLPWVKPRCALPCVLSALSGYHGSNPGVPSHAFSLLSVATMGQTQVCPPMRSLCSQWLPWVKPRCALPCVLSTLSGYHGSNPGVPSHAFSLLPVATMGQTQVCPPMRSLCSQWLPWVKPRCALPCVLSTLKPRCALPCVLSALSGYHGSNPGVPSHAFSLLSVATMGQTQVCPPMRSLCSQWLPWVKPRCASDSSSH